MNQIMQQLRLMAEQFSLIRQQKT
jgi:hypothetical protein